MCVGGGGGGGALESRLFSVSWVCSAVEMIVLRI